MAHLDFKQKATHDYAQYFLTLRELELGDEALKQAFKRMAFNVLAANCDDHTKNFSFLLREGSAWALAPAYDITYAYDPRNKWLIQHLMSVNGKFAGISRADLLIVADRFGIGTAKDVIHMVATAIKSWPEYAGRASLPSTEIVRIQKDLRVL